MLKKIDPKLQKVIFLCFSERCHGNICILNLIIVVLEFKNRDICLLFAILFSPQISKIYFYQVIPTHEAEIRP